MDTDAAERLHREVARLYEIARPGARFSVNAFADWVPASRQAVTSYLKAGGTPDPKVLARMAERLGTDDKHLWAVWLGFTQDNALERIASELGLLRQALTPEARNVERWVQQQDQSSSLRPSDDDPDTPDGPSPRRVYRPSRQQGASATTHRRGRPA